ncbi:MAG: antitoxin AF2212-like protein [Chloroflexota bacterium]
MAITVSAIYKDGVLRPESPLPLVDGERVTVTLASDIPEGSGPSTELIDRLLAEFAPLQAEGLTTPFSGEDHDEVLYPRDRPK